MPISCGSARSIELPVLSYNSPSYLAGVEITGELMSRLIEQLPNFVGVKEASFNSEKFLEISRAALAMRPDFAMLTGVEYLLPSVPLGGVGSYSAAGSICPNLCSQLFDACMRGDWPRARELQYKISWLWLLFRDQYPVLAQGRHGDDGPPGRADSRAACRPRPRSARPISAASSSGSAFSTPSRTAGDQTS